MKMIGGNWDLRIAKEMPRLRRECKRTYENENTRYEFKLEHIKPVVYYTVPPIIDFEIFVRINEISKVKKEKRISLVDLGRCFSEHLRNNTNPLANKYYEDIEHLVSDVVCRAFRGSMDSKVLWQSIKDNYWPLKGKYCPYCFS